MLETDSGKVSALSCLALCSELTTVSFELWLHFAGTCIGHFLHCICALLDYLCVVLLTTFKAAFLPLAPEYFLNSFTHHQ